MRTTVNIEESLLRRARELAVATGRPLGAVIDDGLRVLLAEKHAPRPAVELPTYGGSGLMPGVDLESKDACAELLDGEGPDLAVG